MARGRTQQEIDRELRRRALAGESTPAMLTWLKADLEGRGLDAGECAFCMVSTFTHVFDLELSPGRLIAAWDEFGGHLTAEELIHGLGPLALRTCKN